MGLADLLGRHAGVRRVERVQDAREADVRVLEALRELGCDPAQPRGVRHFVYLPDPFGAAEVADTLEREGWETSVRESHDVCLLVASNIHELTEPLVGQTRSRLEALADAYGGQYDGWEADAA